MRKSSIFLYIISFIFIIFFSPWSSAATLKASVNQQRINTGETVQLFISADQHIEGKLDLTALKKDFSIISTAMTQQLSVINGNETVMTQWNIELLPKRPGKLIIPALNLQGIQTEPITIQIDAHPVDSSTANNIFMLIAANPVDPFVNSEVKYKLRVFYNRPIKILKFTEPQLDNAMILQLGQPTQYETNYRGKNFMVFEQNFSIFPQKAGELKIFSPILTGVFMDEQSNNSSQDPWNNFLEQKKPVTVSGELINLTVKPALSLTANEPWLPARMINLTESWQGLTKNNQVRVGVPITRSVIIKAQGVPAEKLPDIKPASLTGISTYTDKSALNNSQQAGSMLGERTIKIIYIPAKNGEFTLPPIQLKWWNLTNQQWQIASLPKKEIYVLPASNVAQQTQMPGQLNFEQSSISGQQKIETLKQKTSPILKSLINNFVTHQYLYLMLISCILILILLIFYLHKKAHDLFCTIKYAFAYKQYERAYLNDLKNACHKNQAEFAKIALLSWARVHWATKVIMHLSDIILLADDHILADQIKQLASLLYAPKHEAWQGDKLWNALIKYLKKKNKTNDKNNKDELPPLNSF